MIAERFDTAIVTMMDADEARACVTRINAHMNAARIEVQQLYERRGWVALGYATWRECVSTEFERSQAYLYRQLAAAEIEGRISPIGEIGRIPEGQLRPLAALTPMEQPVAWQEANERSDGRPTARVVEEVVKEMRGDTRPTVSLPTEDDVLDPPMEETQVRDLQRAARVNPGMFTSATPEWYTPQHIIDRVLRVFGEISLDPCSNSANEEEANVPAENYYTAATDGLSQPWHGRVYMNPPYGDEIPQWVDRMVQAFEGEEVDEAIALLPARTDTNWFRPLGNYVLAFIRGRLKFSGSENSAPFPSVVIYLGPDKQGFIDAFEDVSNFIVQNVAFAPPA